MPRPTTPAAPITTGITLVLLAGGIAAHFPALSALLTALAGLLLVALGAAQVILEQRATRSTVDELREALNTTQDRMGRLESRLSATESALNLANGNNPREATFARRR